MAKGKDAKPIRIDITLGPVGTGAIGLTSDQVCRLVSHVGNQVVTWLRHDVKDLRDIPVVCNEGTQRWSSEDDKCHDN
jgi:hypothetical protein